MTKDAAAGTVYDLGYAPHEGERLGRSGAIRAILKDGVRRCLGLGRKPRTKVMPWVLIGAAIIPAAVIVSLSFFLEEFELGIGNPFESHASYFDTIGTLSMLFVALITPTLLIPDRRHGLLEIYASRPVRASDYLLARAGTLAVLASAYILIPHATLYIGIGALHDEGLWAGLMAHGGEIPLVLATTAAYVLGYGAPAFLISLYAKRTTTASGLFVMLMVLTQTLAEGVPRGAAGASYRYLALLSMFSSPVTIRDWFFGKLSTTPIVRLGLPKWTAIASILALVIVTAWAAHRRYRREL
jgi:ABC-2 type transport system permease protein